MKAGLSFFRVVLSPISSLLISLPANPPLVCHLSSSMKPPARNHQHQNQNQNQSQSSSPGSARSTGRKAASPATNGPSSEPELRERMSAAVTAIASQSANILLHSGKVRHVPITSTVDYLRCRLPLLPITPTAHFLCRLRPVPILSLIHI